MDATDRRRCRLRLTEPGGARLDAARAEISERMASLLQGLSAEERASLAKGLEAVRRELDLTAEDQ
jgi:DNA-binding MarR family transcriptional regulator